MRSFLMMIPLLALAGCGSGQTPSESPAAPVEHIQNSINAGEEMKKSVQEIGKANKESVDKTVNEKLKGQ